MLKVKTAKSNKGKEMTNSRRGKRASGPSNSQPSTADTGLSPASSSANTNSPKALTQPQFALLVSISLAITHIIDLGRCLNMTKDAFYNGVVSPENSTALVSNATAYCAKNFQNLTEIEADFNNPEEVIAELGCTASDMTILNIRYQTSLLRIALCIATSLLCWADEPLLKSWNFAYGTFITLSMAGLVVQSEFLIGNERFSMIAMLVLIITSSRTGRQPGSRIDINKGLFNIVLFLLIVLMSYIISNHLILGIEEFTNLQIDDVTPGGKATWNLIVTAEYSIVMIVGIFALFFFDEGRKRALLVFMGFITIYHAFIQLPSQRDFWVDPSARQNFVMGMFACMLAGALIPSFDQFVVKR